MSHSDNPIKWAKTLIGYANDKGETVELDFKELTNTEKIIAILRTGGAKSVKELQESIGYRNRSRV